MRKYDSKRSLADYADMLDLPHPVSKSHPQMSIQNRAAQFAPFAALTGYEDAIEETGRLSEERVRKSEEGISFDELEKFDY